MLILYSISLDTFCRCLFIHTCDPNQVLTQSLNYCLDVHLEHDLFNSTHTTVALTKKDGYCE